MNLEEIDRTRRKTLDFLAELDATLDQIALRGERSVLSGSKQSKALREASTEMTRQLINLRNSKCEPHVRAPRESRKGA